jgi:hypothetical protein
VSIAVGDAVVMPTILPRSRKITPAPRKPIPLTIVAAIRGSLASAIFQDRIVNTVEPTQIKINVRRPAGLSLKSRSKPISPPAITENTIFKNSSRSKSIRPPLNPLPENKKTTPSGMVHRKTEMFFRL